MMKLYLFSTEDDAQLARNEIIAISLRIQQQHCHANNHNFIYY